MIEALRKRPFVEQALGLAALTSAALLAGAHIFQALGYAPCALCLDQREAHWTALAIALAGLAASVVLKARFVAAAAVGAAALIYSVSAGLAFFHAGVEFGYWPGPPSCSGGGGPMVDAGGLLEALNERPKPPSCEEAAWRLFGVSMAGYNVLASAGLFALTLAAALGAARQARRDRKPAPPSAKPATKEAP